MSDQRQQWMAGGFVLVLVTAGLSVLLALPANAVQFTAPAPNSTSNTSSISVTMTFDQDDLIQIDAIQLVLVCTFGSTTRVVIEDFNVDGTRQGADDHTVGNATVTGTLVNHGYGANDTATVGHNLQGRQSGYGYTAGGGYGVLTNNTGLVTDGAGSGYGYVVGASGQDLTYTFTLDRSKFAVNEQCYAVLTIDTPLAGDFMSPRSTTFRPRAGGGGGGGGGTPGGGDGPGGPGTPVDSDGDGIPDAVEIQAGTDPNDPNDFPGSDGPGPSVPADSDGDGVPDQVEILLGTDPNDADSVPDFQVPGLRIERLPGGGFRLSWDQPGFPVMGFQVWRSTSPWVHLGDIGADQTFFIDEDPPEKPFYAVTYYLGLSAGEGYVAPGEEPGSVLSGFPEEGHGMSPASVPPPVETPQPTPGPGGLGRGTWWAITLGVVVVAAAIAVGLAMLLQRKEHGKK